MGQNTGFGKFSNSDSKEDRLGDNTEQGTQECDTRPMDLQKKMELRIKALEGLVNNTGVIAFLRSPAEDAPVEFISKGIEAFGYKVEDFTSGKVTFGDLIHPEDKDRAFLELTENALEGASELKQTYRIRTKKEYVRFVEERTAIMRDDNGKVIFYQGVLEDITDKQ
ncbi:PAS domain-containing protein [Methanolobus profundi]|uniref:histidine kinase n=1 Tax=Methanolobus profundi TaxID=487685 RepID=A0A1I4R284_9EURY|nr:PAS domain-containing protein [Methanolobus profundi]SFM46050.1 PAS domain S-box-containing protein [Methanolobus profundi]